MSARIYQPSKNAMQSGRGRTKLWVLEYEPLYPRSIDPLMGWNSTSDTNQQIRLQFETKTSAVAYAERNGLDFVVMEPKSRKLNLRSYSDNFKFGKIEPWTH
ncbi:MAG: hypothetical protein TECD_01148 [Hyphomicrobiaceae bacterium hypho_1]